MAKIFEGSLNDYANVTVGKHFTNEASYIIGYWEAGDILANEAMKLYHPLKDRLFFPICYNYRQFIELFLKQLILEAEEIYYICEGNNMQIKEYKLKLSDKIHKTHSIEKLLNWLIIILSCISEEKMNKEIIKSILEYHKMDKTGQKFRYPKSTNNVEHFEFREDYNLEKIKNVIKTIGDYLMGIDAYLSDFGDFTKRYIAEMEAIYKYEYNHQEDYF
jgi:hypothetical protein